MFEAIICSIWAIFALIGIFETFSLIRHKIRCKEIKIMTVSLISLKGNIADIEYILKSVSSELCWIKNGSGRLVVIDSGLDPESEKTIRKIQGVELVKKDELYPLFENF